MRIPLLAACFFACFGTAPAAMAPPRSVEGVVSASTVIAVVKIVAVKASGDREFATAIVLQSLKGAKEGQRLTIESRATLAETARYKTGEECIVFLGRRGGHYETPLGMFGKYVVRKQKVLRWIIGRERPENTSLKAVISEITAAQRRP